MLFISPPFGNYLTFLPGTIPIKGSFTLLERKGLIQQIFKTLRYSSINNGWINKIGLRNKGIDYALQNYKQGQILSIAILEEQDMVELSQKIPKSINLEINVSCPNAAVQIPEQLGEFIQKEREWCIIKLSPKTTEQSIDMFYKLGFRQFHCCNTLPTETGGLSGPTLIPFVEEKIKYIKNKYQDTTVIAGGGIQNINTLKNYKMIGADHFAISTICFNPLKMLKLYYDYQFNFQSTITQNSVNDSSNIKK